ncbi:uncharacterized protein LOC134258578 [Saccostrea cucullata]|uniref:uncharacterized protein LOC134258578 n=1 Tax=Saccostrea cuccullata TaxID=36930 RepID=UPI002ED0347B
MEWTAGIVLILSFISLSGALLHGNSNVSVPSNKHTDPDVYKQLLHLETNLVSVYKEMATLKEQNLQQKKTSEEQQQLIHTLNQTIQSLKSDNGVLKGKLDSLNSTCQFCQQNYSNVDDTTKELKLQTLSLAIMELNKTSSEDIQTLRNIIRTREQEVPKNITSVVNSLTMNDRYISLSLLDVQNNITALGSSLQQQQKTQTEQHKLTQAGIQNLTFSLNNSTTNLRSSLSDLKTRLETTVAFTAGVGSGDNKVFSPGQTVIFRQVIYQVGGGYNPTTGIFTAPKAGLYLIFCTNVAAYHETFWTKIMINGSGKAGVMAYLNGSVTVYLSASNFVVHQLQVGDRVWIEVISGNHLYSSYSDTTFSLIMINGSL